MTQGMDVDQGGDWIVVLHGKAEHARAVEASRGMVLSPELEQEMWWRGFEMRRGCGESWGFGLLHDAGKETHLGNVGFPKQAAVVGAVCERESQLVDWPLVNTDLLRLRIKIEKKESENPRQDLKGK